MTYSFAWYSRNLWQCEKQPLCQQQCHSSWGSWGQGLRFIAVPVFYVWHYRFSSHKLQSWWGQSKRQRMGKKKEGREGIKCQSSYRTVTEKAVHVPVWDALWFLNIFWLLFMPLLGLKRPCWSQILSSLVFQSELPWDFCVGLENIHHLLSQAPCWCCLLNACAWAAGTQEISGLEIKVDPTEKEGGHLYNGKRGCQKKSWVIGFLLSPNKDQVPCREDRFWPLLPV